MSNGIISPGIAFSIGKEFGIESVAYVDPYDLAFVIFWGKDYYLMVGSIVQDKASEELKTLPPNAPNQ